METVVGNDQSERSAIVTSRWRAHAAKIFGAVAVLITIGTLVAVYLAGRPWYRGRPISFWFDGLNQQYRFTFGGKVMPSTWGSANTWVNLENPQMLMEFQPFKEMGAEAIPFLVEKLNSPVKPVDSRKSIRKRLPLKLKWLAPYPKPQSEQQLLALWILGELGPIAHGTVSNVVRFVNVPGLDYVAIDTLGKINAEPAICVPAICKNLVNDSDAASTALKRPGNAMRMSRSRPAVLKLLRRFGPDAHDAAPLLLDEMESCENRLRAMNRSAINGTSHEYEIPLEKANLLFTAEAFCRVDPEHQRKAIPHLAKILRGEEFLTQNVLIGGIDTYPRKLVTPGARARAARCLSEIGSPEAVSVLKDVLKDDDANVAAAAREVVDRGAKK